MCLKIVILAGIFLAGSISDEVEVCQNWMLVYADICQVPHVGH